MDEMAALLKLDPLEFRLRNYAEKDESNGHKWSSKSLRECYAKGAEAFGWSKRSAEPGSMRDGRLRVGYGMATSSYPANFRQSAAKVIMDSQGQVQIQCGTQDLGTGTYTILTQIAAEALGVDVAKVTVRIADTKLPPAPGSGGSTSAASAGSAVQAAAKALRGRILAYAVSDPHSPFFDVKSSDFEVKDGRVTVKGEPTKSVTYVEILDRYGKKSVEQTASVMPGMERGQPGAPPENAYSMYGFGAHFCEVRVDADLGIVRVARWTSAHALGKILNRKTCESQLRGGIVWGIGMALLEETLLDPVHARFVNSNLAEYHVPVMADVPPIDVHFVDEKDSLVCPLGSKGAGEIGICGAAAAIANAVYHATGKRVRSLPLTLDKLL